MKKEIDLSKDFIEMAFSTIQQATGRVPKEVKDSIREMNPGAAAFGRLSGLKSEKTFADKLHSNKRMEIEHKAGSIMMIKSK